MTSYKSQADDLLEQHNILTQNYKEIYPWYKLFSSNSEIQQLHQNVKTQINNVYLEMDSLSTKISNENNSYKDKVNTMNKNIENSKKYYSENKPKLENILESNKGSVPREYEINTKLYNNYLDTSYLVLLLGLMAYSLRKLLY